MKEQINRWNSELSTLSISDAFDFLLKNISGNFVFSTSFGIEDQMLTEIIHTRKYPIKLFTLDTGRQFPETYSVFERTQKRYPTLSIYTYYPSESDIQSYVKNQGVNGFYASIESRKHCCNIRKIKPLERALKDADVWITGLRAEQSLNRASLNYLEWDTNRKLIKYNPLLNLTLDEVELFVKEHNIPINALYHKGYLSIGCEPCTKAIKPGEDFRSGRWWWENSKKECGLH